MLLCAFAWIADIAFDDPIEPGRIVHPGPRTTWLTEPLLPDGGVDYVGFVRAELRRGVTAENNFTPVLSASLEEPIQDAEAASDFKPPTRLLETWQEWSEHEIPKSESETTAEDDDPSIDANDAWIEGRFDGRWASLLRRWLDEMSPALDCIAREARRRERVFVPLTVFLLMMSGMSSVAIRRVMPVFLARALKRANEGDAKGCVDDFVMAFELLGRSERNSETLYRISRQVGELLISRAVLLAATRFPVLDCAAFRRSHGNGPESTVAADLAAMVRHERLTMLDFDVCMVRDPDAMASIGIEMQGILDSVVGRLSDHSAESGERSVSPGRRAAIGAHARSEPVSAAAVDALLMELNDRFDRLASILSSQHDWSTRIADVETFYAEVERESGGSKRLALALVPGVRRLPWLRAELRQIAADQEFFISFSLLRKMAKTFVQETAECDANRVRCAVACFKNEHHRPPRDMAELAAGCFDAPPVDRVCGRPMRLSIGADGVVEVTSDVTALAERLKAEREAERYPSRK